jgi:hypothetical protein
LVFDLIYISEIQKLKLFLKFKKNPI